MMTSSIKILFSVFISAILIFILLRDISFKDFVNVFKSVDLLYTSGALIAYMVANIFRVERLYMLLEQKIRRSEFYRIIFLYNFLNAVSPVLGATSHIYLIKQTKVVNIGNNVGSFIASRMADAIIVAFLFAVFSLSTLHIKENWTGFFWALFLFCVLIGIFISLIFRGKKILEILNYHIKQNFLQRPVIISFFRHLNDAVDAIFLIYEKKSLTLLFIFSLFVWLAIFLSGVFLLLSVGIILNPFVGMFSFSFPIFASLLPVTIPGGIGVYEASLAGGLALVGVVKTVAISGSFAIHIQELAMVSIFAGFGFIIKYFNL